MRELRTKMIHKTGTIERTSESTARSRAESVIESDTMMVHTIMHTDGSGVVSTYRRNEGEVEWAIDTRLRFTAGSPTRFTPRSEPSRPPHSLADTYLGS